MKTDGLMKLIKSLSDIAVRSWVVGEKGWVIVGVGAVVGGAAFIKLPCATACACWLFRKKGRKKEKRKKFYKML